MNCGWKICLGLKKRDEKLFVFRGDQINVSVFLRKRLTEMTVINSGKHFWCIILYQDLELLLLLLLLVVVVVVVVVFLLLLSSSSSS